MLYYARFKKHMANPNIKREQLSLSQYEELKAKQGKKKPGPEFSKAVLLLFSLPIVIFIGIFLGYIFYIRSISAH